MAKKKEIKPLLEITPASLIRRKHKYYLGVDNRMCKEYCHLIDSIASDKGWNLDEVEWEHKDGRRFLGLNPLVPFLTYEELRAKYEECLTVVFNIAKKGWTLVVGQSEDIYICLEYRKSFDVWEKTMRRSCLTAGSAFKWVEEMIERG